jgi:hypothetical protein
MLDFKELVVLNCFFKTKDFDTIIIKVFKPNDSIVETNIITKVV